MDLDWREVRMMHTINDVYELVRNGVAFLIVWTGILATIVILGVK